MAAGDIIIKDESFFTEDSEYIGITICLNSLRPTPGPSYQGLRFDQCFVRNTELDNTLSLEDVALLGVLLEQCFVRNEELDNTLALT